MAVRISDEVLRQIEQIESSGNPNARAKTSSATGLYQFINATWMETVQKHAPELLRGRSQAEVLDLRTDPDISRRLGRAFTEDNARTLERAGVDVTPGRLYLAHFLGVGHARSIGQYDPNAPLEEVLPESFIEANESIMRGRTVSDLERWAEAKMGGVQLDPLPEPAPPKPGRRWGERAEFWRNQIGLKPEPGKSKPWTPCSPASPTEPSRLDPRSTDRTSSPPTTLPRTVKRPRAWWASLVRLFSSATSRRTPSD